MTTTMGRTWVHLHVVIVATCWGIISPNAQCEPSAGLVPLPVNVDWREEKVFRYEPIPSALGADQARHVLGGQGQLWGEYIATAEHRMYMTYPRAAALAEVLWSPQADRDYDDFLKRLTVHAERLKQLHVPYRPW